MLKPEDHIAREKKAAPKKSRMKVSDLPPKKGPRGGGLSYSKEPPLLIPPRGFITPSQESQEE